MIKLYRNDADITSIEAAESVDINKMEKIVFECIDSFGKSGCIQDDVLEMLPQYGYGVTARFKGLENKGMIVRCDTTKVAKSGRRQRYMMSKRYYDLEDITEEEKQQGSLGV
tara:strand:+ start:1329 stop:1664 length:336 start_codon:yes stop_codon:yes gene_type:complete